MSTNKEMLTRLSEQHLQLAADFYSYINKQDRVNQRVLSLLESDNKTKQKGVVEKVKEIDSRVSKIETDKKITSGKIAVGVFLLTSLGGFISWILGIFDN